MAESTIKGKVFTYDEKSPLYEGEGYCLFLAKDIKKGKPWFLLIYDDRDRYLEGLANRKKLDKAGVDTLIAKAKDEESHAILLKYKEGERLDAMLVREGSLTDEAYFELFRLSFFARFTKHLLEFRPENFYMTKNTMFYLSETLLPYDKDKTLEKEDIRYFIRSSEAKEHLKRLGHDVSNFDAKSELETNRDQVLTVVKHYR